METLSARACIRYGWETFKKRPWFFIGAVVVYFIVLFALDAASSSLFSKTLGLTWVAVLVNWAIEVLASIGLISFMLKAHDNPAGAQLSDLWNPQPFWRYLGAYILLILIVLGGFILLIVPGIIWAIMFGFAMYVVIDRGKGPMEALRESARITKGHRWMLLRLGVLSALVALLGIICLAVGILVAIPVTTLASVHAYRMLSASAAEPASGAGPVAG